MHIVDTLNKIMRATRRLHDEIGREPTPAEIAEKLHLPLEKVWELEPVAALISAAGHRTFTPTIMGNQGGARARRAFQARAGDGA
jgi:Sigma-70 region 3